MCGFVSLFQPPGTPLPVGVLRRMLAAIRHRGPDDEGLHGLSLTRGTGRPLTPADTGTTAEFDSAFAFARLAIQDLTQAGHQPMTSADGRIVLVFNGEIYNAAGHRTALLSRGLTFHGHSDTEVILRLYEVHGWEETLRRLEGMFAIAIMDLRDGTLRAARDHFGIKPLYYTVLPTGALLIASEIKAFLAHPDFRPELQRDHLPEQLMFRYTAWDRTLLRGVQQLPPGHELSWQPGQSAAPRVKRWWSLPEAAPRDQLDAPARVRGLLRQAVQSQMVSDVPLGTQLSGGIDSSLVTLDAASAATGTLHSFSIVFDDPEVSEDPWITQAARAARVHSHRYLFSPRDFATDFARVTWHLDGPPGNPNTLAIDLLAREARQRVKVLLTGEGCDEIFAGYNRFYYTALQLRHPAVFRAGAALCGSSRGRLWRLFGQAAASMDHQMVTGSAYGAASLISTLLPEARVADALQQRLDHLSTVPGSGISRQIQYEAETYLPDLLLRQDKMTMAHGVECRVPFLDLPLVSAARTLSPDLLACPAYGPNARMRGTKRLIKSLAAQDFGAPFALRKKRGFDVPLAAFFLQEQVRTRMQDEWLPGIASRGLLSAPAVQALWNTVNRLQSGSLPGAARQEAKSAAEALWVAVGLEVWASQVLDGKPPANFLEARKF